MVPKSRTLSSRYSSQSSSTSFSSSSSTSASPSMNCQSQLPHSLFKSSASLDIDLLKHVSTDEKLFQLTSSFVLCPELSSEEINSVALYREDQIPEKDKKDSTIQEKEITLTSPLPPLHSPSYLSTDLGHASDWLALKSEENDYTIQDEVHHLSPHIIPDSSTHIPLSDDFDILAMEEEDPELQRILSENTPATPILTQDSSYAKQITPSEKVDPSYDNHNNEKKQKKSLNSFKLRPPRRSRSQVHHDHPKPISPSSISISSPHTIDCHLYDSSDFNVIQVDDDEKEEIQQVIPKTVDINVMVDDNVIQVNSVLQITVSEFLGQIQSVLPPLGSHQKHALKFDGITQSSTITLEDMGVLDGDTFKWAAVDALFDVTSLDTLIDATPAQRIVLQLKLPDRSTHIYRMAKNDPLHKMAIALAKTLHITASNIKLVFDGNSINLNSSPEDNYMEDDDMIDVHVK